MIIYLVLQSESVPIIFRDTVSYRLSGIVIILDQWDVTFKHPEHALLGNK